jgi:hypothetical protein
MSNRIHELLSRNLQEVFGEGDTARRRAAIEDLYTDDCVLYVPPGVYVGRDALDKFAGDLRATHPNFVYTPHGEPQALHNAGRLAWGSGLRGEKPDYTGLDVIIVRDDKIAALYVFLDSMPSWRNRTRSQGSLGPREVWRSLSRTANRPTARQASGRDCALPPGDRAYRTDFLANNGTLENAQAMAAQESPRTTKLYDRTSDKFTLDEVERIAI